MDHVVVLGEVHLRRILTKYAAYYNELRTHRSLNKDAPIYRAIQHMGCIISAPILGGLHHLRAERVGRMQSSKWPIILICD